MYADWPHIFTKGSLAQEEVGDGAAGDGYPVYVIFSAEVYALLLASGHANGSRAVVFSDSVITL